MADRSAEWELSKENIQPLRRGRLMDKLTQDPKTIDHERQTYEANLRLYSGSDPLKPWYDYIQWIEQTFPKGGADGGLACLLKKCVSEFKSVEKYNQDPRYLDIWLKYASTTSKPLECFNYMYQERLFTDCSQFYLSWAWEFEQVGNTKRAESVYQNALKIEFPLTELDIIRMKHKQFQTRIAKKVIENLNEEGPEEGNIEEERKILSSLKGKGKKRVVGSIRTGNVVKSDPVILKAPASDIANGSKQKFEVFQEGSLERVEHLVPLADPSKGRCQNEKLPCDPEDNTENEMAPGKWTSAHIGKKSHAVPIKQIGLKPSFLVHEDKDIEQPATTPCKLGSKVLSAKKPEKDGNVPIALFEPFDPSVRPMYCKHLIYQGVSELSFEELKAARFKNKLHEGVMLRQQQEWQKKLEEQEKLIEDQNKAMKKMQNQHEMLRDQLIKMEERMMTLQSIKESQVENQNIQMNKVANDENVRLTLDNKDVDRSYKLKDLSKPEKKITKTSCYFGNENDSKSLKEKKSSALTTALEDKENSKPFSIYSDEGHTNDDCHDDTKALLQEESTQSLSRTNSASEYQTIMKKMWGSSSNEYKSRETETKNPDKGVLIEELPTASTSKKQNFEVFMEEQPTISSTKKPNLEIFVEEPPALSTEKACFEVHAEEPKVSLSPAKPKFEIFVDEQISIPSSKNKKLLKDREEYNNIDQRSNCLEDKKSGSLPMMPGDSSEENKPVNSVPKPKPAPRPSFGGNGTIIVPSMEDFASKPLMISTPAFGKHFIPEDDDNTCSVQIIFKKPNDPEKEDKKASLNSTSGNNHISNVEVGLSPIMESSREHDYKYYSSSSPSQTSSGTSSHSGNSLTSSLASSIAEQGKGLKMGLIQDCELPGASKKMHPFSSPSAAPPEKRLCNVNTPKIVVSCEKENDDDDDDDDEMDSIITKYKDTLKNRQGNSNHQQDCSLEKSWKASFTDYTFDRSCKSLFQESKSSFRMSIPSECMSDDLTGAFEGDMMNTSSASPKMEDSVYDNIDQKVDAHKLDAGVEALENKFMGMDVIKPFDALFDNPFNDKIQRDFLRKLTEPLDKRRGYVRIHELLPKICSNKSVRIGDTTFSIKDCCGEGAYGKVFKAIRHDNNVDDTICDLSIVLKVQKPANEWEFYICSEIQRRLKNEKLFMSIPRCYTFENGSVFASEYLPASLLDILNITSKKMTDESIAMYFTIHLCDIVYKLRNSQIIHADIKPDNIMIKRMPKLKRDALSIEDLFSLEDNSCIQVIDFGRSIDMTLFQPETSFNHVFSAKGTLIPEMMKGKPWSYQIDYFGIAATAFCLKFGSYIELIDKNGDICHKKHYKRWWNIALWTEFYSEFLNIQDSLHLPDLQKWKNKFQKALYEKKVVDEFNATFREISRTHPHFL